MGLEDRATAQEIGSDASSDSVPTIGSNSSTGTTTNEFGAATPSTNAPSATPPSLPQPLMSASTLFTPVVPYGGGVSQTGEALAQAIQAQNANQPYNLRIGPVQVRAEADLSVELNDNIGLTKNDRVADVIVTPMGILHGRWTISDLNTLTLNVGIGYESYLLHSQYNSLIVTPDSELSFNVFVGDCTVNFHDNFSYQQDPTQIAQLSNQVRLVSLQNDVGVSAKWDLGQFVVQADYDHTNLWVTDSIYDYITNQSDTFSPQVTWKVNESINAGLNASFADTRYDQSFENDNTSESFGPFVKANLSKYLSVSAAAGGFLTQYDQGGGNGDDSDLASYYANVGVNHQIDDALSEYITAGKQYIPGLTSNYTQQIYVNYGDHWTPTGQMTVDSVLFWQNSQDSDATISEDSNRYGVSLAVGDALTANLNVNVGYQFILKDSDPSSDSYYQNVGTLGMQYNF